MKFKMNEREYTIEEVDQSVLNPNSEEGYFYGKSLFAMQKVFLDNSISEERKKTTLYHELMHIYIAEYITFDDNFSYNEEIMCDISSNSHDIIHKIVEEYFESED